jgi:hypothetical protein
MIGELCQKVRKCFENQPIKISLSHHFNTGSGLHPTYEYILSNDYSVTEAGSGAVRLPASIAEGKNATFLLLHISSLRGT